MNAPLPLRLMTKFAMLVLHLCWSSQSQPFDFDPKNIINNNDNNNKQVN